MHIRNRYVKDMYATTTRLPPLQRSRYYNAPHRHCTRERMLHYATTAADASSNAHA